MKIHRLNDQGVSRFGEFLDALSLEPASRVPRDLLEDEKHSILILATPDIENVHFRNRLDAALYLESVLSAIRDRDVEHDVGLWCWLSLFYFDQVCPIDKDGFRRPGERARHIPAIDDYQKYYRHLLAGPYRVIRAHRMNPDGAMILLRGPLHSPGEIAEQLMSVKEVITNPSAVELATILYYNPEDGSFKRGSAGKGGGSARRLRDILNQLDLTWDLYQMSSNEILQRLPREFNRFVTK